MRSRRILAIGLALCCAACGSPGPTTLDGITIMRHGFMDSSPAALYTGPVVFKDGCVVAGANLDSDFVPVLWPPDGGLGHEGQEVILLVGGLAIHDGDQLAIGGGEYADLDWVRHLSGTIPESCRADYYWLAGSVAKP